MTLNNTVNNWAMEIESFKIKFVHIAGKDNILADMLRLIDTDPDVELQPELKTMSLAIMLLKHYQKQRVNDKWGFGYLIGWFVGGTSCTLQTLYAWLMRGFVYCVSA